MFWKHNYKIEGAQNEKLQERQIFLSLLSVNKRIPLVHQTQNNTKPCHMKEDQSPNQRRATFIFRPILLGNKIQHHFPKSHGPGMLWTRGDILNCLVLTRLPGNKNSVRKRVCCVPCNYEIWAKSSWPIVACKPARLLCLILYCNTNSTVINSVRTQRIISGMTDPGTQKRLQA